MGEISYSMGMIKLKEIVENRLKELELGPVEAAVQGGLERTFIRDIVEEKKKSVRSDKLPLLADALKLDAQALSRNEAVPINPSLVNVSVDTPNAILTGEKAQRGSIIPLFGAAVGGDDGEFVLNGNHLDDVFAPPSLSGIPEAYAVRIVGDSMSPRWDDNDTVFVNPNRRPVKGDYVIAQILSDEHGPQLAYIKKLVRYTQNELILEQFNPPKTLKFDGHLVVTVHYVLRSGE